MSLREQMQNDVAAVFLNEEEHAKSVVYRPRGGTARTISAIVDEDETSADIESVRADAAQIMVFVSRDSQVGINDPQADDRLDITRTNVVVTYKYAGTREDADESGWWLRFLRVSTARIGGNVKNK